MNGRWTVGLAAGSSLAAVATAVPLAAAPWKAALQTDVRLGYDGNAFLTTGSDVASGYAEAVVTPSLSKHDEQGDASVSGYYDATRYFEHYGQSNQYGGKAKLQRRLSSRLGIHGTLRYDSEVIGQDNPDEDVTGPPIDDTDVNLIGLRRRAHTLQASGGWDYRLSARDAISADGGFTRTRYKGPSGDDSDNYGGRVAWKHAISPRSRIGLSGSVYYIDYATPKLSTLIVEPDVTFSTELSPTWHVDAAIGVTFSRLYLPLPLRDGRATGLSGNLNLCHKAVKDDFCLSAVRSVTGSGAGGTVERSQVGAEYRRRLTETLSWIGNASYTRSKSQSGVLDTREYLAARGRLEWIAKRWLTLGAEARYRDIFGGPQVRGGYGGEVSATLYFPARP